MSISSKSVFAFGPLFVGLLPVLAGCSMDASSDSPSESRGGEAVPVATQQSAVLTGTQTAPESGSRPSAWATPDIPRFTKLFRGQKVKIHLEAPDDELRGRDLRVFVSSLGFDGWSVRRQVSTWTVDGPETALELDLAELPLRPVGSASEVRIEVEFLSPDAEDGERIVRIPSQAVSVAFSPDESEVYVGTQNDVVSVELASQLAIDNGTADVDEVASLVAAAGTPGSARKKVMRFVERGLGHLAGNVTADDGFVYPIEEAPREGILGSPESRGEHPANGPAVTLPGSWVTPKNIFPATAPPPGSPTKLAFFSWSTTSFRDSDFGEKALPGPNSTNALFPSRGRAPMSYVHVTGLNRTSSGAVDCQNGYDYALNSAGFLVEESRPAKMVLVFRHTDIGDATRHVFVDGTSFGEANGGLVDLQELDLRTTDPVHVTMVRETPASRAGAVVSTLLTTPSLSVPAVVRVHAGTGCSGTGLTAEDPATGAQVAAEACVSGGQVFLGRNIRQDETGKRFLPRATPRRKSTWSPTSSGTRWISSRMEPPRAASPTRARRGTARFARATTCMARTRSTACRAR